MARGPKPLPPEVIDFIRKKRLPTTGSCPFRPAVRRNRAGKYVVVQGPVPSGPRAGEYGCVDEDGDYWIRDSAHAGWPDHWDVQLDGGDDYLRISDDGEPL